MKIAYYPLEVQEIVFRNQIAEGNRANSHLDIAALTEDGNFSWTKGVGTVQMWEQLNEGNLNAFFNEFPIDTTLQTIDRESLIKLYHARGCSTWKAKIMMYIESLMIQPEGIARVRTEDLEYLIANADEGQIKLITDLGISVYPQYPENWYNIPENKNTQWFVGNDSVVKQTGTTITRTDRNKNTVNTKEQAQGLLALSQLIVARDYYNKDWKPDWTSSSAKWCIVLVGNRPTVVQRAESQATLHFQHKISADIFLKNFEDLIIEARAVL